MTVLNWYVIVLGALNTVCGIWFIGKMRQFRQLQNAPPRKVIEEATRIELLANVWAAMTPAARHELEAWMCVACPGITFSENTRPHNLRVV